MRTLALLIVLSILMITPGFSAEKDDSETSRGYALLNEAYQARREGNREEARGKLARALDIFRRGTEDNIPGSAGSETEYLLEKTPEDINLIENKTLFKIEFRNDPEPRSRDLQDRDKIINQQQMLLQTLILLTRENAELKKAISRVEANTKEINNISDMVNDIRDDTSDITGLNDQIEDVKDNTDDIYDSVDKLEDVNDNVDTGEDVVDEVSDLRDDMDILKDILNIVEDIRDDTDDIKDLEDSIDEVKNALEDGDNKE